jgi:hypothetical protein
VTRAQLRALKAVAWGTKHFGALVTNRQTRRRDVVALHAKGLVADAGTGSVCDGDGFLVWPECYRQGWRITVKGTKVLAKQEGQ